MKGKVSFYFTAENIGKVRSRIENPSADFSANMRIAIQEAAVEVINANMLDMRSKLIAKFQGMNLTVKDAKQAAAIANPLKPFFDVVASLTPIKDGDSDSQDNDAPEATDAEQAPADDEFSD